MTTNNPNVQALTDANFDDVVRTADAPILVDFWAEWCGPCRTLGPVIESLADEYADRVIVAKIDVDANPGLAQRFGIRSIPTVLLFRDGEVSESWVGVQARDDYATALEQDSATAA